MSVAPGFWDDSPKAQGIMWEVTSLRKEITVWDNLAQQLADALELAQLGDKALHEDLVQEIAILSNEVDNLEFKTLFSGQYDKEPAFLALHAGAGGTEAQDWAQMLQRMFIRWAEAKGFKSVIIDLSPGEEAGIKSTLMSASGDYAFGQLKSERGVAIKEQMLEASACSTRLICLLRRPNQQTSRFQSSWEG